MSGALRRGALAAAFYAAAFVLAFDVVSSAVAASRGYAAVLAFQSPEEKTDTLVKSWLGKLSLGWYEGGERKDRTVAELTREADEAEARASGSAVALLALAVAFLAWAARAARGAGPPVALIANLLGVAGLFLLVGLSAPILTVSARGDFAVIGEVVLQHDTKGVLSTIAALAESGNVVVAVLLGTFSVIVPVLKLVMSLLVLAVPKGRLRQHALRTIDVIGKWSMTDVFVVAILLAFLAAETEQLTDAAVGPGLYFFTGYGILSLLAGHLMVRHEAALVAQPAGAE